MTTVRLVARARLSFVAFAFLAIGTSAIAADGSAAKKPSQAAIASANALATDAGMEIFAAGGNAFDAAVAVSSTLGLVEPESSGLGGGAFMLLHVAKDGRDVFIDAREKAPLAATRDMFLDKSGNPVRNASVNGALASAIPGLPAGLVHLSKTYGKLPLETSLGPAIRLARKGFPFGAKNIAMLNARRDTLKDNPAAAKLFLRDGAVPAPGTPIVNEDYARVLERLAKDGEASFYRGDFARKLVDGVRAAGGIWTLEDLAQYRVVEREPLRLRYRDWQLVTAPPPSSGGVALAEILHIVEGYPIDTMQRIPRVHLLVEAMRRAYRDRAIYLGDPDFVKVPLDLLLSSQYAAGLRAGISTTRATPSELLPGISAPDERPETTHMSIIDRDGNLVALTQTVNLPYGAALMVPGTGFMLNNQMDDFSVKPGTPNAFGLVGEDANAIEPGKRPLSSMTPTFLIGPERVAVLGSPGGSRIITMVLNGLLEVVAGKRAIDAVTMPRFHHQYLPDVVSAEPGAFTAAEVDALTARGFTVNAAERPWGNMQVVVWDVATGKVEAASDPRWKGVGKGSTEGSIYR